MLLTRPLAIMMLSFSLVTVSHADSLEGLAVYRGIDGSLSSQSKRNFLALTWAALLRGRIDIWLTFDMPFVGNPALRTAEIAAQEAAIKQDLIDNVVMPLVQDDRAELLPHVLTGAPGCYVSVSALALVQLVRNVDVKRVDYLSSTRS